MGIGQYAYCSSSAQQYSVDTWSKDIGFFFEGFRAFDLELLQKVALTVTDTVWAIIYISNREYELNSYF